MRKADITPALVECLVREQFAQWAHLPVTPVEHDGWDNASFRLGDELSVRLPSSEHYAAQVDKEHRWLPVLAPYLPLPIPRPVAKGVPGCGFPRPWSVYGWLPGAHATAERVGSMTEFARSLGEFLLALYAVPAAGGPAAGQHNFWRGASPAVYDEQTRAALALLGGAVDVAACARVWDAAIASEWERDPVWVHGDLSASNLLAVDGRLSAVIDFGTTCVGDPACDLAITWTFFDGASRDVFAATVGLDEGTWARGRGWTLWKALITLAPDGHLAAPGEAELAALRYGWRHGVTGLIEDLVAGG
jgi:aminoglycoside phosphotransferase (APT) family kinase protein